MIMSLLTSCLSLFKPRCRLLLENAFLRKQLEIATRTSPRLRLRPFDRFFFSTLTAFYSSWKETLLVVKPETVI